MQMQKEKAIVRAKDGEIIIFWLESLANYGKICCNGVINNGMLCSMGEATYEYYRETKKATAEQIATAISAAKSAYDTELIPRQKLSSKDREFIWAKV